MSTTEPITIRIGDMRQVLAEMGEACVDAIVTDPPYELGFMGRAWDASGIAYDVEAWKACLRVLKPGGHLLAFGGTRTYHRMACAIEDAGFEIRDSIHWIYGSGFPKGQDVGKLIDRRRDDREQVLQVTRWLNAVCKAAGWGASRIDALFGMNGMGSHWTSITSKAASVPTPEQWDRLRVEIGFDDAEIRPLVAELNARKGLIGEAWEQREVIGQAHRVRGESDVQLAPVSEGAYDLTAPATDEARTWRGWNTQLKPAHEPIVVARKSTGFNTTVANVLEHGTGAINIEACRTIAGQDYRDKCASVVGLASNRNGDTLGEWNGVREDSASDLGRWPTNLLLNHTPGCDTECAPNCPAAGIDKQSGKTSSRSGGRTTKALGVMNDDAWIAKDLPRKGHDDAGGASRFFPTFRYEAKAPASERPRLADGTAHTTVKPLALMRWLVRLVTPPGGTVLDPFAGSGTTGEACLIEGFNAVLVELDPAHGELINARLSKPIQPSLEIS